jgi:tartrate-resistant acid phosphatase type 5
LLLENIGDIAEFFFVDTTPFVLKYWTDLSRKYDWRGVAPRETYIANVVKVMLLQFRNLNACQKVLHRSSLNFKDLDAALKRSNAPWKIVVGHHAIRSVSRRHQGAV